MLQGMLQPGHGVSPAVEMPSVQPALLKGCILHACEQGKLCRMSLYLVLGKAALQQKWADCLLSATPNAVPASERRKGAMVVGKAESYKSQIIS